MLTYFSVEGYKNFDKRVSLDLSDVRDYKFNTDALCDSTVKCGLIYGRNTSGKTNLGRAIMDIGGNVKPQDFAFRDHADEEADYLNANADTSTARFVYRFRFGRDSVSYEYEKTARFTLVWERLCVNETCVFDFDHASETMTESSLEDFGGETLNWSFADVPGSVLAYVCNNAVASQLGPLHEMYAFVLGITMLSTTRTSFMPTISNRLASRVIARNLVSDFEDFLGRFGIEERLVVKETPDGEQALYFKHKKRLISFARNCSSGTAALFSLFDLSHLSTKPSLCFIDEFDAFYHYDLAEKVIGYLKDEVGSQVICTTHNTDLFSNKVMRPDCLFILTKKGLCSAANATNRELREGHNLEKLYKAGEFDV